MRSLCVMLCSTQSASESTHQLSILPHCAFSCFLLVLGNHRVLVQSRNLLSPIVKHIVSCFNHSLLLILFLSLTWRSTSSSTLHHISHQTHKETRTRNLAQETCIQLAHRTTQVSRTINMADDRDDKKFQILLISG